METKTKIIIGLFAIFLLGAAYYWNELENESIQEFERSQAERQAGLKMIDDRNKYVDSLLNSK